MNKKTQPFNDFESLQTSSEKTNILKQAEQYLDKYGNPNDVKSFSELHGFLSAAACIPMISSSDQWLEFIFKGEVLWENENDKTDFSSLLSELHSEIQKELETGANTMSVLLDDNGEPILKDWCSGFCRGTHLWDGLPVFSAGANVSQSVVAQRQLIAPMFSTIQMFGDPMFNNFLATDVLTQVASDSILDEVFTIYALLRTSKVRERKIGRNHLCLCGSGKKHKKCCLRNEHME